MLIFCETRRELRKKADPKKPLKKGSLQSYKSAVSKFRVLNGFPDFCADEEAQFARYFRGVGNQVASLIRDGVASGEEGKRHIPVDEHIESCYESIKNNNTELHLALTHMWNLCSRADTTANTHAQALDFEGDAFLVGISKSKRNSQEQYEYFHTYANVQRPEVFFPTALALHCAVNSTILSRFENVQSSLEHQTAPLGVQLV